MIPKNGFQFTDIHKSSAPAFFHTTVVGGFKESPDQNQVFMLADIVSTVLCYLTSNKLASRAETG